jgi:hypothetical protein
MLPESESEISEAPLGSEELNDGTQIAGIKKSPPFSRRALSKLFFSA